MIRSAYNYLKIFPADDKISKELLRQLKSSKNLFDYQEAWILKILRHSQKNILKIRDHVNKTYSNPKKHWYVRCQAVNILADGVIKEESFDQFITMYREEQDPEIKRTLLKIICQLDKIKQYNIILDAVYDPYYKISTLGKMLMGLRYDTNKALHEISFIFNDYYEYKLRDNFYKLGVIRYHKDQKVLEKLNKCLTEKLPMQSKYLNLKCKLILKQISYKQLELGLT